METGDSAGRSRSEQVELYEDLLEFFSSKAVKLILLPDIEKMINAFRNDLEEVSTREKDLFIKGQIHSLKWLLNLKEKYKREGVSISEQERNEK